MAVRKLLLTISYDGADYHGWVNQPGQRTVQQILNEAASSLIGRETTVTGASRTDAGVSALGQRAQIEADCPIPTENFLKALNDRLPDDIAVTEVIKASADFDVISNVKSKLYRYTIFTGPVRPVLQVKHCWHQYAKLDVVSMEKGAKLLVGKKDFKSFASAADNRENSVRTILRCDVTCQEPWVYVDVEGNGFLYNMVRNIVGTLVEVGMGRMSPEKISEILKAKDRTAAGPIAPANGLCLMWIKY